MKEDKTNSESGRHNHHTESYEDDRDDDVFYNYGSFPRTNGEIRNFESSNSSDGVRSRSLSLPYVCNSRTYRHSGSYDHSKKKDKLRASSLGYNGEERDVELTDSIEEDVSTDIVCCGFNKRQMKCGFALALLSFSDVMGFGIFAPFFPIVAEKKNISSVEIGLIFAGYSIAGIFASIFTGTLLVRVGAKFIIIAGMFLSAGATLCFGLLNLAPEESFFYLCFACRLLMGIGSSSAFTALFAVIFQEFTDRALVVIGISETLCSIGGIIGPLIGGGLYQVGGFMVPFAFLGVLQITVLIICYIMIPHVAVERQADAVSPAWLLLNPHGLFAALFVALAFFVNSFTVANISIFLTNSFHLTPFMIGVVLLTFSICYGIFTPIWGYFAERKNCGPHMMTLSCFISGIVMMFYGPADILLNLFGWTAPHEWLVYVCTGALGAMMGSMVMPTFGEMIVAAKQMKLQDSELAEYGLVSGLWNTVFSVGDILGPTVGGVMIDDLKFGNTCAVLGIAMCALAVAKTFHLIYLACKKKPSDDKEENKDESYEERRGLLSPDSVSVQA